MQEYVQANFDFNAQPGSGELTIKAGDQLMVIRKNIEGGWMEGQNAKGKIGLFPQSYVSPVAAPSLPLLFVDPNFPFDGAYSPPKIFVKLFVASQMGTFSTVMVFPAGLDPQHDSTNTAISKTAAETARLLARKRAHLVRRHTCSVISGVDQDLDTLSKILPSTTARQVSFMDPNTDKVMMVDTITLVDPTHQGSRRNSRTAIQKRALQQRSSVGNVFKHATTSSVPPMAPPPPLPPNVHLPPTYSVPPLAMPPTLTTAPKTSHDPWDDPRIPIAPPYMPPGSSAPASASATQASSAAVVSYPKLETNPANTYNLDDDFDDDWSDEDEEVAEYSATQGAQRNVARSRSTGPDSASMAGKQIGTSKMKTINRFSNFVKTGMESYILAATKINSDKTEKHVIVLKDSQIEWLQPKGFYTCAVNKPKKESKLKGRYEEDLIEHRKSILQVWVNKICRHPVLSQSNVWKHFMTCTDANNWKKGKRAAEKDEYVGGNFFHCIEVPEQSLDSRQIEKEIDGYAKCVRSMDESTRELFERITDNQKRLIGPYKSNWQKMGAAFDSLGKSLDLDTSRTNSAVKNAIKTSAHTLHKIGNQHEEHGKKDMEQLLDYLYIYKGLFTNIPDIVNVHRSALSKIRDNDRLQAEGKLSPQDADAIHHRVDVTTYSMMAEISHFNKERDADFRLMFGDFFSQQAAFYSSIGNQMAQLAALYKN